LSQNKIRKVFPKGRKEKIKKKDIEGTKMNMEYSRGGYTASNVRRQDVGNKRSALRVVSI